MSPSHSLLASTAILAALTFAPRAHACWDGRSASTPRVTIALPGDDSFDTNDARSVATWLLRLQALLSATGTVYAYGEYATICTTPDQCVEASWKAGVYANLFDLTAQKLRADAATVAAARRMRVAPWTVQVFASRDRARAEAVALRVDEPRALEPGYYEAGGFPANNPVAHVVPGTAADGRAVWRVIAGAYLERGQALATKQKLASRGFAGFVRLL